MVTEIRKASHCFVAVDCLPISSMEDRITGSPDHCMVLWGEYVTMEAIIDFLRAALPWIAIGLLLAVFAVRNAGRKKKEKESDN